MINKDLNKYSSHFSVYTELRIQENRNNHISMVNGDVMGNSVSSSSGVSSRVYNDGNWGFSSSPDFSDSAVEYVLKNASDNVLFMNKRNKEQCGFILPDISGHHEINLSTQHARNDQKQWIDFLRNIDDYIAKKYSFLSSRTVVLSGLDMEKSLLTSAGSTSYSMTPRGIMYISLTMDNNGEPVDLMDVFGGLGQLEDHFLDPSHFYSDIDILVEHLQKKSNGVYADAGLKEVILDADLAGILAHEAIGHTTEADLVLGGSVAGEFMGEQVASELVTLVDYANTMNKQVCPVPVYIDDEGTPSEDTVIIEDGSLKSFMHNKDSARHFNTKPTGNARAYAFSDEPLIRMRNTAIQPGTSTLEEMISSIDDGYYLMKSSNGQADSTSEFMFGVPLGYEIKGGKLGNAIKDTTISGVAFDVLKTIDMISSDMTWSAGGMCGKKQWIPVGMGGPAIKCKVNIGGR
ncbi:MAG: TldD/PmbA family protein [Candidatus Neomarinimicrobiota bacterium]|nr:TldD/PmbA family protein [Candidatus Neomarinimicrobiota bacterium]